MASLSRRRLLQLGSLAAGSLALGTSGCAGQPGATAGPRVLRVAQSKDVKGLDPHLESGLEGMNVLINIFDTLTERDVNNRLVPRLATSWEAVDDHRWRFHLRDGVRFHNGESFDADAVKFSIERLVDPATKSTIVELRAVKSVEVIDRLTADFLMSAPDPVIPEKVSLFGGVMLPPQHLRQVGAAEFARRPVGTGPFTFLDWHKDVRLRLGANAAHWKARPAYDELHFLPMPNASSALANLQSDGVDLVSAIEPEAALQLKGFRDVDVLTYPGIRMNFVVLDTRHPILKDLRVRQALNHAVDVPLLIRSILDGTAREAPTIVPREAFGFDDAVKPFVRDQDRARNLLAEAGYPDGLELTFTASNKDLLLCQALAGMLRQVGVDLKLELLEPGTYATRLASNEQNALGSMYLTGSTGWTLDGEATMQSYIRSDRRRSRISDPYADRMIDILEQNLNPEERLVTFGEMQRWLHDQAPFLYLYQSNLNFASNGKVDWKPNVIGTLAMESAR